MASEAIRILLVEDNPGHVSLVTKMLANLDDSSFRVASANSLQAGFDELAGGKFDVVLLDLGLPDSSGLETYRKMHNRVPRMPIVILSAIDDQELAVDAVRKGAQDYLVKGEGNNRLLGRVVHYAIERGRLEQLREEFVSAATHELRTPVTIAKEAIAQMVEEVHGPTSKEQQACLAMTAAQLDRMERAVNDLLDLSKLEFGHLAIRRERVDLLAVAQEVLMMFAGRADRKGIALRQRGPEGRVEVYADHDRVTEILMNLIGNALKFTERGSIELRVARQGDMVECAVADTGRGITTEDLPKLFGKFQRVGPQPIGEARGSGLGLAICKGLVELHGGQMHVESEVNQGTTLTFTLPCYSAQAAFKDAVQRGVAEASEQGTALSVIVLHITNVEARHADSARNVEAPVDRIVRLVKESLRRRSDLAIQDNDTILMVLPGTSRGDAEKVAGRIGQQLSEELPHLGQGQAIGHTCKVLGYPDDGGTARELLATALPS